MQWRSSGAVGVAARDYNMYVQWDIQYIQGLQNRESCRRVRSPRQRVAGVRCSAGLKRWCCMHGIYTGMLPAGKREKWHGGWGTNEQE